ncbi:MAG: trypsin-like peptidase domain-containing protein [Cyanobacteriota bacterium]|nr:trypsin-like peptidase domain-containing protein [Cyanobacteriota bacterium]
MQSKTHAIAAIALGLGASSCALSMEGLLPISPVQAQQCGTDLFSQAGCLLKSVGGSGSKNNESTSPGPKAKENENNLSGGSLTDLVPKAVNDYIKLTPPKILQPDKAAGSKLDPKNPGLPPPDSSSKPKAGNKLSDYVPGLMLNTPGFDLGIGDDNREPMTSREYPWSTIGLIVTPGGGRCTGALIRRDVVLTNAHCTGTRADESTGRCLAPTPNPQITFQANFNNGVFIDSVRMENSARGLTRGTNCPDEEREKDWAIIKLERPVNNSGRWMETRIETLANLNRKKVIYAGYSSYADDPRPNIFLNGRVAGVDQSCSLHNFWPNSGTIGHSCDMGRGGSGGPIFQWVDNQAVIVAVNSAEFRGNSPASFWIAGVNFNASTANIAVPLISFQEALTSYLDASDKSQYIVHKSQSGIGGPWGDWGKLEFCPAGTKATGYTQDVQSSQGRGVDDWSMSNFYLHCTDSNGKFTRTAGSHSYASQFRASPGTFCPADTCKNPGDYQKGFSQQASKKCPAGEWITAFALKVESNQGAGDDTAGNSAKIRCSGGQELEASNAVHWGDSRWGPWQASPVPNSYVCGARSKVERSGQRDNTALNDIELYWCQ